MHIRSLARGLKTGTCLVAVAAQVACTPYGRMPYRPPQAQRQPYPFQGYSYAPYVPANTATAAYGYPPPPVVAAQPQPAPVEPAADSGPSPGALLLGALIVGGLVAAAAASSSTPSASDAQGVGGNTNDEGERLRLEAARHRFEAQQSESNRDYTPTADTPDTSVGCAWGDRSYGTCH